MNPHVGAIKEPSGKERDAQAEASDKQFGWCRSGVLPARLGAGRALDHPERSSSSRVAVG